MQIAGAAGDSASRISPPPREHARKAAASSRAHKVSSTAAEPFDSAAQIVSGGPYGPAGPLGAIFEGVGPVSTGVAMRSLAATSAPNSPAYHEAGPAAPPSRKPKRLKKGAALEMRRATPADSERFGESSELAPDSEPFGSFTPLAPDDSFTAVPLPASCGAEGAASGGPRPEDAAKLAGRKGSSSGAPKHLAKPSSAQRPHSPRMPPATLRPKGPPSAQSPPAKKEPQRRARSTNSPKQRRQDTSQQQLRQRRR